MPEISGIITVALVSAFIILALGKTGLRDRVIERAPGLLSRMFSCDFCLGFWTAVAVSVALAFATGDMRLLINPVLAAPLIRILV